LDRVILAVETRKVLADSFDLLRNKRQENPPRKHGNIPL
jgi:propionyl-CoA carboxylase beta chain